MLSVITVLIPSIGRPTLKRTLESLCALDNPNWLSYVGFDGCAPEKPLHDPRITYVYLDKVGGGHNHGGMVRNSLFDLVTTDWMCFLDDDDTFRKNYVDVFEKELAAHPDADCIVFRMSYNPQDTNVLPPLNTTKPQKCQVGISFAVRRSFLEQTGVRFLNSSFEDYYFLEELLKNNGKIVFSNEIVYNIRF